MYWVFDNLAGVGGINRNGWYKKGYKKSRQYIASLRLRR